MHPILQDFIKQIIETNSPPSPPYCRYAHVGASKGYLECSKTLSISFSHALQLPKNEQNKSSEHTHIHIHNYWLHNMNNNKVHVHECITPIGSHHGCNKYIYTCPHLQQKLEHQSAKFS